MELNSRVGGALFLQSTRAIVLFELPPRLARRVGTLYNLERQALAGGDERDLRCFSILLSLGVHPPFVDIFGAYTNFSTLNTSKLICETEIPGLRKVYTVPVMPVCRFIAGVRFQVDLETRCLLFGVG